MLPKISGNSNFSNIMDAYKKSFYNKKFSNDVHFSGIQGKKAYWSLILSSKFKYHFLVEGCSLDIFLNISIFSCMVVRIRSSPSSSSYSRSIALFLLDPLEVCGLFWTSSCSCSFLLSYFLGLLPSLHHIHHTLCSFSL